MTKKPVSLSSAMAKKAVSEASPEPSPDGQIKILTIRLPLIVHEQLREMAFTERRSQQALVMEALNLLFEQHGKPPIAS